MQLSKMKKTALNLLVTTAFLLLSSKVVAAADPRLYFSPATGDYHIGDTFTVTMMIDSAGQVAGAADMVGTFDTTRLEITKIETATDMAFNKNIAGGSCTSGSESDWTSGKFSGICYSSLSAGDEVASGNLMTITFKAKAVGVAHVNYTCNGLPGDSNVTQTDPVRDIIVCSANGSGSYTITEAAGGATGTTPTPTLTVTTTASPTSTAAAGATELPQTGGIASTVGLIIFGAISLASALFLKFL